MTYNAWYAIKPNLTHKQEVIIFLDYSYQNSFSCSEKSLAKDNSQIRISNQWKLLIFPVTKATLTTVT